ncbi:MAG: hypothetical protein JNN29_15035 [Chitinophagaceae bacterium]|nr:hypothetical protein [Chitinophagaceae bacterium]
MILSYQMGQKYYPVPYAKKKLLAYLVLVTLIYLIHRGILQVWNPLWFSIASGTVLLLAFGWFISKVERKEVRKVFFRET